MKIICVLSDHRCGTNWLFDHFHSTKSIVLYELFNPTTCVAQIKETLGYKLPYDINETWWDWNWVKKKKFDKNYLKHVIKMASFVGKRDYLLFKIFPEHLQFINDINRELVSYVDTYILNYRRNTLRHYISYKKSVLTGVWNSKDAQQKNINKNDLKIKWDLNEYLEFSTKTKNGIDFFKNLINGKNSATLIYEDVHETDLCDTAKHQLIKLSLLKCGVSINSPKKDYNFLKKELVYDNIQAHFSNPEEFNNDIKSIAFIL